MCRSEPHTPVSSIRTTGVGWGLGSGLGRSSSVTTPGPEGDGTHRCGSLSGSPSSRPPLDASSETATIVCAPAIASSSSIPLAIPSLSTSMSGAPSKSPVTPKYSPPS
jgi:hypothetical protein